MLAGVQTEAIKAIYDAALSENRWQAALDCMVDATKAKCGMLYDHGDLSEVAYSYNTSSAFFADKRAQLAEYNRMTSEGLGSDYDREGIMSVRFRPEFEAILDDEMFVLDEKYDARPEVGYTKVHLGFYRRFILKLTNDPRVHRGLIFQYRTEIDDIPSADLSFAEMVGPHVANALEIHRITQPLRMKYKAALSVLDMIDLPIVLFSKDGTAILKNRAASDVMSARDALWLDRAGRLRARRADTIGVRLSDAVRRMSETARGAGQDRSVEIEIPRGTGAPIYAIVSPVRDADMELERGVEGALMTLIDPTYPIRPRVDLIGGAYGLTPGEMRVATLIAEGATTPQIAERLEVSPETVKSQTTAIFDKTGSRGRLAFLWRVFQFSPPVR